MYIRVAIIGKGPEATMFADVCRPEFGFHPPSRFDDGHDVDIAAVFGVNAVIVAESAVNRSQDVIQKAIEKGKCILYGTVPDGVACGDVMRSQTTPRSASVFMAARYIRFHPDIIKLKQHLRQGVTHDVKRVHLSATKWDDHLLDVGWYCLGRPPWTNDCADACVQEERNRFTFHFSNGQTLTYERIDECASENEAGAWTIHRFDVEMSERTLSVFPSTPHTISRHDCIEHMVVHFSHCCFTQAKTASPIEDVEVVARMMKRLTT